MTAKNFAEGNVVCVNATHGTNAYDFSSCLVHNITNKEDRVVLIESHSKMAALGYVYTLEKQVRIPPNAVQIRVPPALISRGSDTCASSCMTGFCRCLVSSVRRAQTFGRKKNRNAIYFH